MSPQLELGVQWGTHPGPHPTANTVESQDGIRARRRRLHADLVQFLRYRTEDYLSVFTVLLITAAEFAIWRTNVALPDFLKVAHDAHAIGAQLAAERRETH
jgi:hypothetical protein